MGDVKWFLCDLGGEGKRSGKGMSSQFWATCVIEAGTSRKVAI